MNSLALGQRPGLIRLFTIAVVALAGVFALAAFRPIRPQNPPPPAHYPALFVWAGVPAGGLLDGSSWANAFTSLDAALAVAVPTDQIWVAIGNYVPTNPTTGFAINMKLRIYGGFAGTESSLDQRQGWFMRTVLSGNSGACTHVISVQQVFGTPGVVIDGFLITGGDALNHGALNGGGIWCHCSDLDIANCTLRTNVAQNGGGIYFEGGCFAQGNPQPPIPVFGPPNTLHVKLCEFDGDSADIRGGGIYGALINGECVNARFQYCQATQAGGGVYLDRMGTQNHFDITNGAFYANYCTGHPSTGGGVNFGESASNGASNSTLVNCTFAANFSDCALPATSGPGVFVSTHSQVAIYNSIFWYNYSFPVCAQIPIAGNPTIQFSDLQFIVWGPPSDNNQSVNPLFRNLAAGNLTLNPNSICVDAADYSKLPLDKLDVDGNGNVSEIMPIDLLGNSREFDYPNTYNGGVPTTHPNLDMGAYDLH